jgi:hypothetical protein
VRNQQLLRNMLQAQRIMRFLPKRKSCTCVGVGCKCEILELEFSGAARVTLFAGSACAWCICCMLLIIYVSLN